MSARIYLLDFVYGLGAQYKANIIPRFRVNVQHMQSTKQPSVMHQHFGTKMYVGIFPDTIRPKGQHSPKYFRNEMQYFLIKVCQNGFL